MGRRVVELMEGKVVVEKIGIVAGELWQGWRCGRGWS